MSPETETEPLSLPPTGSTENSAASSADDEPPADVDPAAVEDLTKLGRVEEPPEKPKRRHRATRAAGAPARRSAGSLERRLYEALGHVEQFPADHPTMAGAGYYTGLAGAVFFIDAVDASTIAMHSANVARAWALLAEENPKVRLILERSLSGGAWGGAILATLAMLLPIAANHGLLPGSILSPLSAAAREASVSSEPDGSPASAESPVG